MDAHRFKKVQELFEAAVDQDSAIRDAFIAKACGDDQELAEEVRTLVRHRDDATLSPVAIDLAALAASSHVASESGSESPEIADPATIGPYRVLEKLGEGGMGAVYKAEDSRGPGRMVAVKVMRNWAAGVSLVRRFGKEQTFQGRLSHPSIAALFDAGRGDQGEPYLVMEFVDGLPITRYADKHNLSVGDRIRLMIRVCRAVHHAHQKSIVHRDLKPGNILVIDTDEGPLPKIIDFGVAKSLEEEGAEPALTQERQLVGTIGYMAPEQIEHGAHDLDIRSDVYALGVILYELLVGCRPHAADTARRSTFSNRLRLMIDVPPPRASALAKRQGPSESLPNCGLPAHQLARRLTGDLDVILLKAVAGRPEDRYESALDFARDLERHLSHEPVQARPAPMHVRATKFARRNRLAVAILATIAVVVSIAIALIVDSAHDARIARAEALRQNDALTTLLYRSRMAQAGAAVSDGAWRLARAHLDATPESRRGPEWSMLDALVGGGWRQVIRTSGSISAMASHPDGDLVALGLRNGVLLLVGSSTGSVIAQAELGTPIDTMRWRSDGAALVVATAAPSVSVLDSELNPLVAPAIPEHPIADIAFTERESRIVVLDDAGGLHQFNMDGGDLTTLPSAPDAPSSRTEYALASNGGWIAACSTDGTWALRDPTTFAVLRQWDAPPSRINNVAVNEAGDVVALERDSGAVVLATVESNDAVRIATVASGAGSIAMHDDQRVATVMDPGGRILMLDLAERVIKAEIPAPFLGLAGCTFTADGTEILLATNDGALRSVSLASARSTAWASGLSRTIHACASSEDSRITATSSEGLRRSFDWSTGVMHDLTPVTSGVTAADVAGGIQAFGLASGEIILHADDDQGMRRIPAFSEPIRAVRVVAATGELIAASVMGAVVQVSIADSSVHPLANYSRSVVTSMSVDSEGERIALLWHDGDWLVQDIASEATVVDAQSDARGASIELSPHGKTVFIGGADGRILAFDVDSASPIWVYGGQGDPVLSLRSVAPDRLIAGTQHGAIVFIDAGDGEEILTLRRTESPIISITIDSKVGGITCTAVNGKVFRYQAPPQLN